MTVASGTYVPRREEEAEIRQQVEKVRADGRSRAVLLHGPGGAGKTMLVRHLADRLRLGTSDLVWVDPIDVDDSEYWLLSNLETAVAEALGREHFTQYFEHLGRIARFAHEYVSYETVLAQLSRINRTFVDCYRTYVQTSKITVVLTLDTIEAIRSMYLLLTLTQWMKELPHTLFILSGRPPGEHEPGDPLREELDDPHRPLENIEVALRGFADDEARRFIKASGLHESLTDDERDRLVDLTSRQPLWLALAVEYLQGADPPTEMTADTAPTATTRESFRRKLVTLYRSTDFWPEAIKRLAVVRHSVNQQVWSELMADRGLPPDATDWAHAWGISCSDGPGSGHAPTSATSPCTTHSPRSWHSASSPCTTRTARGATNSGTVPRTSTPGSRRRRTNGSSPDSPGSAARSSSGDGGERLVAEILSVDAQKRELDQLLTAQLHYAILDDFSSGAPSVPQAVPAGDGPAGPAVHGAHLPSDGGVPPRARGPVSPRTRCWTWRWRSTAMAAARPRALRRDRRPDRRVPRPQRAAQSALQLLKSLPDEPRRTASCGTGSRSSGETRTCAFPARSTRRVSHFLDALAQPSRWGPTERALREAEAHKELGFYYRNLGSWVDADAAYRMARDVLARIMGPGSPRQFREEMASIQTNWAYLNRAGRTSPASASLVDFGLYAFHNAKSSITYGRGPYFYLPKLEKHLEARLWNDMFAFAGGAPRACQTARCGRRCSSRPSRPLSRWRRSSTSCATTARASTPAAGTTSSRSSRTTAAGQAVRSARPRADQDDRAVHAGIHRAPGATCHKRGAHAIGGMSAFIPNRRDPEATERALEQVPTTSAGRPATDSTAPGSRIPISSRPRSPSSTRCSGTAPNQVDRQRDDVRVTPGRTARHRGSAGRSPTRACGQRRSRPATSSRGCAGSAPPRSTA